ncbi:hypothetical protein IWX49DRAFT_350798 [Phyllosticta citricarpa]
MLRVGVEFACLSFSVSFLSSPSLTPTQSTITTHTTNPAPLQSPLHLVSQSIIRALPALINDPPSSHQSHPSQPAHPPHSPGICIAQNRQSVRPPCRRAGLCGACDAMREKSVALVFLFKGMGRYSAREEEGKGARRGGRGVDDEKRREER